MLCVQLSPAAQPSVPAKRVSLEMARSAKKSIPVMLQMLVAARPHAQRQVQEAMNVNVS
jgi:hypothetical protein